MRHLDAGLAQGDGQCAAGGGVIAPVAALMGHLQREARHPGLAGQRPVDQTGQQQLRPMQHLLGGVGPCEELEPGLEGGGQAQPVARVRCVTAGLIQPAQHPGAEAAGQPLARQSLQVAQALQAHALERFQLSRPRTQQRQRHLVEPSAQACQAGRVGADAEPRARRLVHGLAPFPLLRRFPRFTIAPSAAQGQERGTPGRGRAGQANLVTQRGQGLMQALGQPLQATEQPP